MPEIDNPIEFILGLICELESISLLVPSPLSSSIAFFDKRENDRGDGVVVFWQEF